MSTFQNATSVRSNLIPNPSFETGIAGWISLRGTLGQTGGGVFGAYSGVVTNTVSGIEGLYYYAGDTGLVPTPSLSYTFSIYVSQSDGNSNTFAFQASIEWYDAAGGLLGVTNGAIVTPAFITAGWTRLSVTSVAPAGATRATPTIYSTAAVAVSDTYYFDGALFEQSATLGDYFDGSLTSFTQANIAPNPTFDSTSGAFSTLRTNLVANPTFNTSTSGWYASGVAALSWTGTESFAGAGSMVLTSSSAGTSVGALGSNPVVTAGSSYTASAYVKSSTIGRNVTVGVDWYDGTGYISTNGGTAVLSSTGGWTRAYVTATAPSTPRAATYAQITVAVAGTATAEVHYVDAVLFEQNNVLGDYFDGSTTASGDFTYAWTGTAFSSTSTQLVPALSLWTGNSANIVTYRTASEKLQGIYSGAAFVKNGATSTALYNPTAVTALPNVTYTANGWVKAAVGTSMTFELRETAAGVTVGTTVTSFTATGSWQQVSATRSFGSTGNGAVVIVRNTSAVAAFYVDGVVVERGSVANDFYTGNYSPTTQTVFAWTAMADASISTATVYVTTTQTTPTTYRYLFADLITNQVIAELPLTGVNFTSVLNGAGSFTGSLLVTDATQSYLDIWNATQPARTALFVERFSDGGVPTLVWGGIVWNREYSSTSQHITLNAAEFESYFDRRRVISPTSATSQVYTSTDQLEIAKALINNAQIYVGSSIGVITGTETSAVTVSKTYYDAELKTVLSAIQDLAKSSTGFDFKIDVSYDGAFNPVKTLILGYPRLGTAYSTTNASAPVMEFPGNVVEYVYTEDGSTAANYVYASGAGNGQGKLNQIASDNSLIVSGGWPLLEDSRNYGDVTSASLLTTLASGQLAAVKNPPVSLKIVYPPSQDPILGSYNLGDDVRVRINDDRAGQTDDYYRLVAISVTPGETGPERATLTLTQKGAV